MSDDLEQRRQQLIEEFIDTEEMADYFAFVDAVKKRAVNGVKEITVPAAFLARAMHEFQPMDFPHLREVHNALCDKLGLPDEKERLAELTDEDTF